MAGFIKPKTVDKAMIAADPAAAFVGYLSTILATFGLFEWLGLTADQVAILGGAVLGLLATVRVFYEKGRRQAEKVLHTAHSELRGAHEELVRKTSTRLRREDFEEAPGAPDDA
jgi:small neutral amino acid transporter SnatA (MarC family)